MGGKRYETEPKLNIKKVLGVLIGIAVIIMFIITLTKLLQDSKNSPKSTEEKQLEYFAVYTNNKWGVIDSRANIIIEPSYEEMILVPNSNNPIFLCTYDVDYDNNTYKTKAINEKGEIILDGYDSIEAIYNQNSKGESWYENNVFKVSKDGKYGMIDNKGKELLTCNFDEIKALQGVKDCLIVTKDDKSGVYDIYGNSLINVSYKTIKGLDAENKKQFIVQNSDNKYGIMASGNERILEEEYDDISNVTGNDIYVVKKEGKWTIIKADKSLNIGSGFESVESIENNTIIIKNAGKYGIMDEDSEMLVKTQYDNLKYAFGKYYIAKLNGKYGIINTDGETKVEFKYSNIYYVKDADIIIADTDGSESDILDNNLEVKLTGILFEIDTEKGYMIVRQDGINKYYNFKFEEKKNTEILLKNTIFLDKKDGKYGYINNKGELIVDYKYDDATEQNKYGYAAVNIGGKWGAIDKDGQEILEPTRDLKNNEVISFIGKWNLGIDSRANFYTDL